MISSIRSYEYDNVGRLVISHSGAEARAHVGTGQWGTMDGPYSQGYEYDVWGNVTHKYGWGGEVQGGSPGVSTDITYAYTGNRRNGFTYDSAGNLTNDLGQTFTYDATGQQASASYSGYSLIQSYDGNGLRVKKNDNGATTYYLRSSVLGGQVVAEITSGGALQRSYIYLGSQLLAIKLASGYNYWVHEDPVTKSKRVTDMFGAVVSTVEMDPWGADTNRSSNAAFQPKKFTSYERDGNGTDEAMFRRYNRWQSRFDQPDPYDGSYSLTNPQSFNRYAYVHGDPVNFIDPTGSFSIATCGSYAKDIDGAWIWIPCSGSSVTVNIPGAPIGPPLGFYFGGFYGPGWNPGGAGGGGGTGGGGGGHDNPLALESSPNVDCNITVAFSGSYGSGLPNGPGEFTYGPYGQVHGLGFTVYGSVTSGGIGRIGPDINKDNPNGKWVIQQFTSAYLIVNGVLDSKFNGGSAKSDLNSESPHQVTGNEFRWYDHPGVQTRGLTSYEGKFDFTVKAVKGNAQCEVRFHVLMTLNDGNWSVIWGKGGLPR
jgi:RHS repeat-associated protein